MFTPRHSFALVVTSIFVMPLAAQTGPGGVGNSTTNVLWLGADHGVFSDAGLTPAVSGANAWQWNDRSGNGSNAMQAMAAQRPNYISGALNGKPVLRFTAANTDRMLATGIPSANRASVWVVARYSSLPSPNPGLLQGAATGDAYSATPALKNMGMWVSSATTQVWGRGIQTDGTSRNVTMATALATATPYVLNTMYRQSAISQYVNHGPAGSVASNGTLRSWTDMAIGAQAGTENWNGDIAEVIAFNVDVNEAQRLIITSYLAAKYGMTLTASTDVYREDQPARGNYDHEVAGIGRINSGNLHTDARGTGIVRISNPTGLGNNEFMIWGHDNGVLGAWGVGDVPSGVEGRFQRTWRVSERNGSGTNSVDVGAVDIAFDLTGLGPVDPAHLRLLVDSDNDGSFSDETGVEGAYLVSGALYRFDAVTLISDGIRFTLGTTDLGATPLPVELVSFTAEPTSDAQVRLDWVTATEVDNDRFIVEHSPDMEHWSSVASVDAVGNSTTLISYSVMDPAPFAGLNYYRLRQVDLNGMEELFPVRTVTIEQDGRDRLLFQPNPSSGLVKVKALVDPFAIHLVNLFDGMGRCVHTRSMTGSELMAGTLDLTKVPPGAYLMHIECDGQRRTGRLQLLTE